MARTSTDLFQSPPLLFPLLRPAMNLGLCFAYAIAFVGLHRFAAPWGAGSLYSLWFPGAGLRFAFLWWRGPSITPLAAIAEASVQLLLGEGVLSTATPWLELVGMVSPCLIYGLVVHLVRRNAGKRTPLLKLDPLPFALASVLGPIAASVSALPWAIPAAALTSALDLKAFVSTVVVFMLGDMLGVLIVAPPLIWLIGHLQSGARGALVWPSPQLLIEVGVLAAVAWGLVWTIAWAGLGLTLAPALLATCWIGLRAGRPGAWCAMVLALVIVLPITGGMADAAQRLALHMLLACIAAVGYLAGSFAEAETRAAAEIARRDRMLFQAERLKTLRAMSVAVIHEVSQPLSTIAIEAHHLASLTASPRADRREISNTAALIARKAEDLTRMVRRLRRFGDRASDLPSAIPLQLLLADVAAIAAPEAQAAGVEIRIAPGPEAAAVGHDIELRQAVLNLLRNALAASPRGEAVDLSYSVAGECVHLLVTNHADAAAAPRVGMGVGLLIARSIAEAHGGRIIEERPSPARVRFTLELPLGSLND